MRPRWAAKRRALSSPGFPQGSQAKTRSLPEARQQEVVHLLGGPRRGEVHLPERIESHQHGCPPVDRRPGSVSRRQGVRRQEAAHLPAARKRSPREGPRRVGPKHGHPREEKDGPRPERPMQASENRRQGAARSAATKKAARKGGRLLENPPLSKEVRRREDNRSPGHQHPSSSHSSLWAAAVASAAAVQNVYLLQAVDYSVHLLRLRLKICLFACFFSVCLSPCLALSVHLSLCPFFTSYFHLRYSEQASDGQMLNRFLILLFFKSRRQRRYLRFRMLKKYFFVSGWKTIIVEKVLDRSWSHMCNFKTCLFTADVQCR